MRHKNIGCISDHFQTLHIIHVILSLNYIMRPAFDLDVPVFHECLHAIIFNNPAVIALRVNWSLITKHNTHSCQCFMIPSGPVRANGSFSTSSKSPQNEKQ